MGASVGSGRVVFETTRISTEKMLQVETSAPVCSDAKTMPSSRAEEDYSVETIVSRRKQEGCDAAPSQDVSPLQDFSRH
jgi:hypothetical protein